MLAAPARYVGIEVGHASPKWIDIWRNNAIRQTADVVGGVLRAPIADSSKSATV